MQLEKLNLAGMKKYLVLILFTLMASVSFAQSNYQDVVYLKNGSIIRGIIIEQIPNESIRIETSNGSIFVYRTDEIERITREAIQGSRGSSTNNSGLKVGYKGLVELGYQIGTGDFGLDRIKLNIINGYQINPYISMGVGTGMRYYHEEEIALIPIFADIRVNFVQSYVSPYLSIGVGYSLDATYDFKGAGSMINPTIGANFKVSDTSMLNVGFGYEIQKLDYYITLDGWSYRGSVNSGALSVIIGISF